MSLWDSETVGQWDSDAPCGREGSEGSKGSEGSEGGGIAYGDEYEISVTGLTAPHSHSEPQAKNLGTCRI